MYYKQVHDILFVCCSSYFGVFFYYDWNCTTNKITVDFFSASAIDDLIIDDSTITGNIIPGSLQLF